MAPIIRRVIILHTEGLIDSVPCLLSVVTLLARHGFAVDIFITHDPNYVTPSFDEASNVAIHHFECDTREGILGRFSNLMQWTIQVHRACRDKMHICLIGVDAWGLLLATIVGKLLNLPTVYYSLEIFVSAEIRSHRWLLLKWAERVCNRYSRFTITQDRDRASLLVAENHIPWAQIVLVPNSSLGVPGRHKTAYLYRKLGIPEYKKIILCAGSLKHWTMALELVEEALRWPDEWVLVLQTRQKLGNDGYDVLLREKIDRQHVILCAYPVPSGEFSDLVGSADIGIALYRPSSSPTSGTNLKCMGLSSGKIAAYLQHGLPVVTSDFPSLRKLVKGYACGKAVPEVGAVAGAIAEILMEYERYSANALYCFQQRFDFAKSFEHVIQRLNFI